MATRREASAVPTTVLSLAWLLTTLSTPPMAVMTTAGAMVSTEKGNAGEDVPVLPAASV